MRSGKNCTCKGTPKENMSHFEKFVTEGNEKADELAKRRSNAGQRVWRKQEQRQQEGEEVYAALQYAANFHCLVEAWKDCEERKPKPQEKCTFCGPEERGDKTSAEMVC